MYIVKVEREVLNSSVTEWFEALVLHANSMGPGGVGLMVHTNTTMECKRSGPSGAITDTWYRVAAMTNERVYNGHV